MTITTRGQRRIYVSHNVADQISFSLIDPRSGVDFIRFTDLRGYDHTISRYDLMSISPTDPDTAFVQDWDGVNFPPVGRKILDGRDAKRVYEANFVSLLPEGEVDESKMGFTSIGDVVKEEDEDEQ